MDANILAETETSIIQTLLLEEKTSKRMNT